MKFVFDFGRILNHVPKPACGESAKTVFQALTMFERYYEMNEAFDLYTHGMGPGLVGMVVHALMDFLGPLVNVKIDHSASGSEHGTPLSVYVCKLRDIVNSVVCDATEESSGRLEKVDEAKSTKESAKTKTRVKTKQTERKAVEVTEVLEDSEAEDDRDNDEVFSVQCSEDELDFKLLTSTDGQEYNPPNKTKKTSKYSHKAPGAEISKSFEQLKEMIDKQQEKLDGQSATISRLTRENTTARNKLNKLVSGPQPSAESTTGGKKKSSVTKQKPFEGFLATPIGKDLDSSSDDEIQEVNSAEKPDSTQKIVVNVDASDGASSVGGPFTQRSRKRKRIQSGSTASQSDVVASQQPEVEVEDDDAVSELRKKRDELEAKCTDMQNKLLAQQMETAFADYQRKILGEVQKYRTVLLASFGKNLEEEPAVLEAVGSLRRACCGMQYMGYTVCVGKEFVDRITKSLLAGQVPEQQIESSKTDNSVVGNSVQGNCIDVVYELNMPVIVKTERYTEDEDCQFIGLTPALHPVPTPVLNITVKAENTSRDLEFNTQTQLTQFYSPVFGERAEESKNKEVTSEDKQTTSDNKEVTSDNKEVTPEKEEVIPETQVDNQATSDNKEVTPEKEEVIPETQVEEGKGETSEEKKKPGGSEDECEADSENESVDVEHFSQSTTKGSQSQKRPHDDAEDPVVKKKKKKAVTNSAASEAEGRSLRPRKHRT